jgi:hypothetical protein
VRVLVCGSRGSPDALEVIEAMRGLPTGTTVVHGDARGPDRAAAIAARACGLTIESFPAEWEKYGRRAGPIRNIAMLDSGIDQVIAFWDGVSSGTRHTIEEARKRHIPVKIKRSVS